MKALILHIYKFIYLQYLRILNKVIGFSVVVMSLETCRGFLIVPILKSFNGQVGSRTTIKRGLMIENSFEDQDSTCDFSRLKIGEHCFIGREVLFDLTDTIHIGKSVCIGARTCFITHMDLGDRPLSHKYPRKKAAIVIEDDCFIGTGAIILYGVTLGKKCVVGAGVVVRKSYPEGSVIVE